MKKKEQGTTAAKTTKGKAATKQQVETTGTDQAATGTDQVLEKLAENAPVSETPVTEEINQELEKTAEAATNPVENSTTTAPAETPAKEAEKPAKEAEKPAKEAEKTSKKEVKENPFHKIAKGIFSSHSESITEIFFTQDGTPFFEKQHARMHADSLADQLITTVKRLEVK